MFDFMTPIVFAISAVVHLISLVVLVMNHYQQKAHNKNILTLDTEVDRLEGALVDQREAARAMYLKQSDEIEALEDTVSELREIIRFNHTVAEVCLELTDEEISGLEADLEDNRQAFIRIAEMIRESEDQHLETLGQAMAYATDLEVVIEAALDTIMEQRETIDVLNTVVAGGDPYEDDLEDQITHSCGCVYRDLGLVAPEGEAYNPVIDFIVFPNGGAVKLF